LDKAAHSKELSAITHGWLGFSSRDIPQSALGAATPLQRSNRQPRIRRLTDRKWRLSGKAKKKPAGVPAGTKRPTIADLNPLLHGKINGPADDGTGGWLINIRRAGGDRLCRLLAVAAPLVVGQYLPLIGLQGFQSTFRTTAAASQGHGFILSANAIEPLNE
jgi:hypothetical protein